MMSNTNKRTPWYMFMASVFSAEKQAPESGIGSIVRVLSQKARIGLHWNTRARTPDIVNRARNNMRARPMSLM